VDHFFFVLRSLSFALEKNFLKLLGVLGALVTHGVETEAEESKILSATMMESCRSEGPDERLGMGRAHL
jgi:hypothetical protein